jgi:hypothetical protein
MLDSYGTADGIYSQRDSLWEQHEDSSSLAERENIYITKYKNQIFLPIFLAEHLMRNYDEACILINYVMGDNMKQSKEYI